MKKSIRGIIWLATLVLVGGLLASAPLHQARADTSPLMTVDPTGLSATLVSQYVESGQDVVATFADASGETFTIAGPAGTVFFLGTASDGWPYVKVSPPIINTSAITADQAIAQYNSSGFSLYQDAMAVGFSSTEAQDMVNADSGLRIFNHICLTTHWSGADTHECDRQYILQSSGSKDWYIGNVTEASAQAAGIFAGLYWFRTYVTYNTHDAVQWSPANTIGKGSCSNVTVNATYSGVGVSASQNVCPDSLSPFFPPIDGFGTVWQGNYALPPCTGTWEAAPSASTEYDAGGAATDNYSLWVKAKWWDACI